MTVTISDTASVDPRAKLDDHVEIGPYCVLGPDVRIGRGTTLVAHCVVRGRTTIGANNLLHPFAVINGGATRVVGTDTMGAIEIGDENVVGEFVSIQGGSGPGREVTRLGSRISLASGSQVSSGCQIGNRVTIGVAATLGEAVSVGTQVVISGSAHIHRHVTLGDSCFVGAQSRVQHDVPPYMLADGQPARIRGLNLVALKRSGLDRTRIAALREAYRLVHRVGMDLDRAFETLESHGHSTPEIAHLFSFLRSQQAGRHGRARDGVEVLLSAEVRI